jgi:hypothetical protein
LQGVLRIFVFLVVVFCGEDVVICVAGVVFWQSLFEGQKIRHYFVKFLMGWSGPGVWLGTFLHLLFYA